MSKSQKSLNFYDWNSPLIGSKFIAWTMGKIIGLVREGTKLIVPMSFVQMLIVQMLIVQMLIVQMMIVQLLIVQMLIVQMLFVRW